MLAKYYRFHLYNGTDKDIDYNNGGRIIISLIPWKITNGVAVYGAEITGASTMSFVAADEILSGTWREGVIIDNSVNQYVGVKGTIEVAGSNANTVGELSLWMEESTDNVVWPSDQSDIDRLEDFTLIKILNVTLDIATDDRATNFEIGEIGSAGGVSRRPLDFGTVATNALTAKRPQAWDSLKLLLPLMAGGGDTIFDTSGWPWLGQTWNSSPLWKPDSLYLDGTDDRIYWTDPPTISGEFTIVIRAKVLDTAVRSFLGSRSPNGFGCDFKFNHDSSANTLRCDIGNGAGWLSNSNVSLTYATDTWYTIAWRIHSTGYEAFVNGVQIGSDSWGADTPVLTGANNDLTIGSYRTTGGENFYGNFDYVAIFDCALTSTKIAEWSALGLAYPLERKSRLSFYVPPAAGIVPLRRRIEAA